MSYTSLLHQRRSIADTLSRFAYLHLQIPQRMWPGIVNYIEKGEMPGRFLQAVISNDLQGAVEAADDANLRLLPVYVSFFYMHAPAVARGSREKMLRWLERFKKAEQDA